MPVLKQADAVYLGSRRVYKIMLGAKRVFPRFLPIDLFADGERGAWYEPRDISTLFQDSAATTPVIADGDPVGLMLDKSGNDINAG